MEGGVTCLGRGVSAAMVEREEESLLSGGISKTKRNRLPD